MSDEEQKAEILKAITALVAEGRVKVTSIDGEPHYYVQPDNPLERAVASGALVKIFNDNDSYVAEKYAPLPSKDMLEASAKSYSTKKQQLLRRFNSLL